MALATPDAAICCPADHRGALSSDPNVWFWPDLDLPARPLFRRSWGRSEHQSANTSGRNL